MPDARQRANIEHSMSNVQFSVRSGVGGHSQPADTKRKLRATANCRRRFKCAGWEAVTQEPVLLGSKNRRQSKRDERIGHYYSDRDVVCLSGQLQFGLAGLIDVHHDGRCRIVLKCP